MRSLLFLAVLSVAAFASPLKSLNGIFRENPKLTIEDLRLAVQNHRANATRGLLPEHKFGIFGWSIIIGSPKRVFNIVIDTASTETFVADITFTSGPKRGHRYNGSSSTTAKLINRKYEVEKGGVEVSGDTFEDIVEVEDYEFPHRFGSINWLYGEDEMFVDGQLGLGWRPYANEKPGVDTPIVLSVLNRMKPIYQLVKKPQMRGIMFGRDADLCNNDKLVYIPLLKGKQIPMIPVHSFELGNYHYAVEHPAIVDSSYGSILLPDGPFRAAISAYNFRYDAELGVFMGKCDGDHKWEFVMGDEKKAFTLTDKQILLDVSDFRELKNLQIGDSQGRCVVLLDRNPIKEATYTLGTPFIDRYCLSFDVGNNAIGFAENE